jgi:hypothetical protein
MERPESSLREEAAIQAVVSYILKGVRPVLGAAL